MKTVFPTREVYHIWASNTQPHGRNTHHTMSFDGDYAYSYRACIGCRVTNKVGDVYFILSHYTYSITTSKHWAHLRHAVQGNGTVVHLPIKFNDRHTPRELFDDLEAHFNQQITLLQRKWVTANKLSKTRYQAKIDRLHYEFHKCVTGLNAAFDEDFPLPEAPAVDEDAILAEIEAEKAAAEARKEAMIIENTLRYRAWCEGEGEWFYNMANFPMALRVSYSGAFVETSKGASVPVEDALRLWPIIQRVRAKGKRVVFDDVSVGHYQLNWIDGNGGIKVGCHEIPYAELERIYGLLTK